MSKITSAIKRNRLALTGHEPSQDYIDSVKIVNECSVFSFLKVYERLEITFDLNDGYYVG